MLFYKVPRPNQALLITGLGARVNNKAYVANDPSETDAPTVGETQDFKVVTGKGAFVLPFLQRAGYLSLDTRRVDLGDEQRDGVLCQSKQSIPLNVEAVLVFKVGDDRASIVNAARRFLDKSDAEISQTVREMAHGHLRTIVAGLTVEELITERQRLTQEVRDATAGDMQKLGLVIDTMQIKQIRDVTTHDGTDGYIANLGKPQAAAVAAKARMAAAASNQAAAAAEQEADAAVAEATRTSNVRQASAQAETDAAVARQDQAGPLADAEARRGVIEAMTATARLESALTEQRLQAEVLKPAEAKATATATEAEGAKNAAIAEAEAKARGTVLAAQSDAEATRARATAEAEATEKVGLAQAAATEANLLAEATGAKEKGLAEAAGIKARQEALSTNPEGVVAQQIAEALPQIVEAAARQFDNVGSLVVLDGIEGLNRGVVSTVSLASAILPVVKQLMEATATAAAAVGGGKHAEVGAGDEGAN